MHLVLLRSDVCRAEDEWRPELVRDPDVIDHARAPPLRSDVQMFDAQEDLRTFAVLRRRSEVI